MWRFVRWLQARSFAFQPEQLGIAEGLRAATAVALWAVIAEALDQPLFAWAAFAAFWTCLADPGGPVRIRFRAMATFALVGTVLAAWASYVGGVGPFIAAPTLFVVVALCGLARFYGPAATQVGVLASVVAVVAVDYPNPAEQAAAQAGVFLQGCLWALTLCLLLWRIHPYQPTRRAAAGIFRDLGNMTAELEAVSQTIAFQSHRRLRRGDHRRAIRDTIERARIAVDRLAAGRDNDRVLQGIAAVIEAGDRIFAGLIALEHDLDTRRGKDEAALRSDLLRQLGQILAEASRQVQRSDPDWTRLRSEAGSLERQAQVASDLDARVATAWARALADLVAGGPQRADEAAAATHAASARPVPGARSIVVRHALRQAVAVGIAYITTAYFHLPYAYWATMAVVVVMQPQAAVTWPRTLERVIGSVAGGMLAVGLALLFPSPLEILVVVFPLTAVTVALRLVNYTLFVFFLTPLFVLVSDMLAPGHGEGIAFARALNNVLGSLLGLAGCLLLWPDPAPGSFRAKLAEAVDANMAYAALVAGSGASFQVIDAARRRAGVCSSAAEVVRQRMTLEGRRRRAHLDKAAALLAALRGLAGAATVAWLAERPTDPDAAAARAARYQTLGAALGAMVRGEPADATLSENVEPEDGIARAVARTAKMSRLYAMAADPRARHDQSGIAASPAGGN